MERRVIWVLNLDAELELARGRRGHTPSAAISARTASLATALGPLLGPEDFWLGSPAPAPEIRGRPGRAWCPTPSAIAALEAAGAVPPSAPSFSVLRRVNHRSFSAGLGQTLRGAGYALDDAQLEGILDTDADRPWLLKRPFGFAGRGRRRVLPRALDGSDRAWIIASLAGGEGLQVEPWVDRLLDVALHGYVHEDGSVTLGVPTVQRCDAHGAWISSSIAPPGALERSEIDALFAETERTARALAAAGYFGAFGVDGYRFRRADGTAAFQPRSEINARYSMGWAIGMGSFRVPAGAP